MYTSFFGLNEKPFAITPDPRYLFMSERHGEGLAHLVYGVTESGGFIQLTGEVGTGKTTLVRTLLGQIPAEVDIALILNPQLTAVEFLTAICEELGIELPDDKASTKALVDALNRHLLESHAKGRRTILLVDEAQNLDDDVLEQLRLLTNLETARQKLLQIILIAQPELREKLAQTNLRQLSQRVTGRYHLEPLSREEAEMYIDHRLRVAGALTEIFDSRARREVYRLSGGVPRLMNVICDRALLGAYSRESRTIDKRLVRRAANEVSGQSLPPAYLKYVVPIVSVIGLMILGAAIWSVFGSGEPPAAMPEAVGAAAPEAAGTAVPAADTGDVAESAGDNAAPGAVSLEAELGRLAGSGSGIPELLELWGIEYDPAAGSACDQARAQGFSCYFQRGSWNGIRQLDRPVVLTLTDSSGATHQPVLVGLGDDDVELLIGGERMRFPLADVSQLWFGQFMLVWRPPGGRSVAIRPGTQGDNVRWLRQSLAAIDSDYRPQDPDSDYFDAGLQEQLKTFQRQNRLEADGLAGQKTQIIINSMLAVDDTPRLSSPPDQGH
ncbi:MAG: AAA family ATPase [Woeseiaceae bacterium]|nr:AAA family ATPase [Woeseiaceae bacterium]